MLLAETMHGGDILQIAFFGGIPWLGRNSKIRGWLGAMFLGAVLAMLWDDESRKVPDFAKVVLIPVCSALALWSAYPVILEELIVTKSKPEQSKRIVSADGVSTERALQIMGIPDSFSICVFICWIIILVGLFVSQRDGRSEP